jgi:hypothetical protein
MFDAAPARASLAARRVARRLLILPQQPCDDDPEARYAARCERWRAAHQQTVAGSDDDAPSVAGPALASHEESFDAASSRADWCPCAWDETAPNQPAGCEPLPFTHRARGDGPELKWILFFSVLLLIVFARVVCCAVASLRRSRREDDASAAWRLRERQTAAAAAYGVSLESIRIYHRTAAQNQNPPPLAAKDPNRERGLSLEEPEAPTFFEVLMPGGERVVGKTSPRKGASFDAETFADAFRIDAEGFEPSRGAGNDAEESSGESSSRGAERALEALREAERKARENEARENEARENEAREHGAGRRAVDPEPPGGVHGAREREVPIEDAAAEEEGAGSSPEGSGSCEDAASVLVDRRSSGSSDASAPVERDDERERARRDASRRRRIFQDASAPRREDSGREEWTMAVEQANAEARAADEAEGAGDRREGARGEETESSTRGAEGSRSAE